MFSILNGNKKFSLIRKISSNFNFLNKNFFLFCANKPILKPIFIKIQKPSLDVEALTFAKTQIKPHIDVY